jgi:hypothetical protein
MNKVVAASLAAILLAGCATGPEHNTASPAAAGAFQPGVTTIAQAEAVMGQPFLVTRTADGGQQLQYVSKHQEVAGDGIPTTGSRIPKRVEKTVSTFLIFDANGHFVSSSSSAASKESQSMSTLGTLGGGDVRRQGQ